MLLGHITACPSCPRSAFPQENSRTEGQIKIKAAFSRSRVPLGRLCRAAASLYCAPKRGGGGRGRRGVLGRGQEALWKPGRWCQPWERSPGLDLASSQSTVYWQLLDFLQALAPAMWAWWCPAERRARRQCAVPAWVGSDVPKGHTVITAASLTHSSCPYGTWFSPAYLNVTTFFPVPSPQARSPAPSVTPPSAPLTLVPQHS